MSDTSPPVDVIARELNVSAEKAAELFALMNGDKDPEEYASVRAWRDKCYHWPPGRACEAIMCAINEVMEGYGVEAMRAEGYQVDAYHFDIVASYINMGDTYVATVVHDSERDIYRVASYGDWLEEWESEHKKTWRIYAENEEGERDQIGVREFSWSTEEDYARERLMAECWDDRLDAASCKPIIECED